MGVDPIPYTPFNSSFVKFKAKRPIKYAIKLIDWEENLGIGSELNGGNPFTQVTADLLQNLVMVQLQIQIGKHKHFI